MAGGTAVAARAAPTAANPATDAKADDAAMARAKPKADAAALLAGGAGADSKLRVLLVVEGHLEGGSRTTRTREAASVKFSAF